MRWPFLAPELHGRAIHIESGPVSGRAERLPQITRSKFLAEANTESRSILDTKALAALRGGTGRSALNCTASGTARINLKQPIPRGRVAACLPITWAFTPH